MPYFTTRTLSSEFEFQIDSIGFSFEAVNTVQRKKRRNERKGFDLYFPIVQMSSTSSPSHKIVPQPIFTNLHLGGKGISYSRGVNTIQRAGT